ncbi:putative dihydrolipoamide branched chain transacylase [Trypanosoma theileri]|uniref:Dihydrolipoamide acetyltransferase component of pyruvate dehydrogenase complex n=1 Tax=Trypanosoma theileri TaxID=67003 RepID=A0A1X0P2L7_9TRYP|nr:putative dihydrolipoamide branched chain transacylase [Trypanosoma theileri]ORC91135.1 putative dihydrolipoamide branched chain transacylase [Trypanosoma theileri]
MRRFSLFSRNFSAVRLLHRSPLCFGKIVPYLLADIGEGIQEVEVVTVCVAPGDKIEEFEKICEVQSDKATVDITSRYTGIIAAVHVTAGATAFVGKPIIDVELSEPAADNEGESDLKKDKNNNNNNEKKKKEEEEEEEDKMKIMDKEKKEKKKIMTGEVFIDENSSTTTTTTGSKKVLATPATRGLARDYGIDLTQIKGTGIDGRILKEDIQTFHHSGKRDEIYADGDNIIPLTGIRRVMVNTMTEARTIPSYTACDEMELTALLSLREKLKDSLSLSSNTNSSGSVSNNNNNNNNKTTSSSSTTTTTTTNMERSQKKNKKISLMPFFLKAASMALLQYPELNAHIDSNCRNLIVKKSHNISFAVDSPKGLIVPVVYNVQEKSLMDLAIELEELITLGRRNAIPPDRMRNGTFTLSNIGSIGATYATPVILPPQVVIGAIGRLQVLPRFDENGNIKKANIAHLSWTADHRVIDGASLVRFSNVFKGFLESPELLLNENVQ